MRVQCVKVYEYDELSDEAKKKAREELQDINTDFYWSECTIWDSQDIGKLMGIDIENIYFTGFGSQGDGACFEGHYAYKKGSAKAVMAHAPQDTELHKIALGLQALQKKNFYRLTANVKQSGHYSHEYCTLIDVSAYDHHDNNLITIETEDALKDLLRDYMRWIYRQLEQEYEWRTSDDAVIDSIRTNEYEFTEDGSIA